MSNVITSIERLEREYREMYKMVYAGASLLSKEEECDFKLVKESIAKMYSYKSIVDELVVIEEAE